MKRDGLTGTRVSGLEYYPGHRLLAANAQRDGQRPPKGERSHADISITAVGQRRPLVCGEVGLGRIAAGAR
jgi:hypothetical protein